MIGTSIILKIGLGRSGRRETGHSPSTVSTRNPIAHSKRKVSIEPACSWFDR